MVVPPALGVAVLPVFADIAMGDRLRVGEGRRGSGDGALQARAYQPEVGREVGGAVRLILQRCDDMKASRRPTLHGREHFAVGAELEDRASPGFASELGIHRLV